MFSLTCGLRTAYLINSNNLICVATVKCQVKFCLLLNFLHIFLTNLASTGGPHKSSRRAAGWTALIYYSLILHVPVTFMVALLEPNAVTRCWLWFSHEQYFRRYFLLV